MSNANTTWKLRDLHMMDATPKTVAKVLLVVYIILSSIFDFNKKLSFLDNKPVKILLLLLILGVMVYDLHMGILLVIAFLILNIQLNVPTLNKADERRLEMFLASMPAKLEELQTPASHTVIPQVEVPCDNKNKNKLSDDIFDYSVDSKVKPYEVFVKMMTTKDHLDNASNAAFLSDDA